jgi:ADA HAT complex component 1
MRSKKFSGDLQQMVADAKTQDVDDMSSPGEEADDMMDLDAQMPMSQAPMMRMPARTAIAPQAHAARPASSKGPPPGLAYTQPLLKQASSMMIPEEDVDMESPNTFTSNMAPSLVSDDSEYDESDDGSSESGASDGMHAESISDVTEINMEDDVEPPRLRHQGCVPSTTVRLRKDDGKTVTLVSPVKNTTKDRRHRNVDKL